MKRLAVLTVLIVLALPAAASAKIVINKGMWGIHLGQTQQQVRIKLGTPDQTARFPFSTIWYYANRQLTIQFFTKGGALFALYTTSPKQKTSNGIGVGSTKQAVKKRISGVRCNFQPAAGTACVVSSSSAGTNFHVAGNGRVDSVFITAQG